MQVACAETEVEHVLVEVNAKSPPMEIITEPFFGRRVIVCNERV